ncbi:high affinity copper uptake protein 1-like [Panonychus citri]|uniref:high affinity copper uptake protein 1-like n=1 Tax=Panonychus citri TaxID=50023 RepID=UPI002307696E|nr:high affinity copper uptake protein 1-like [Panonychus citri]
MTNKLLLMSINVTAASIGLVSSNLINSNVTGDTSHSNHVQLSSSHHHHSSPSSLDNNHLAEMTSDPMNSNGNNNNNNNHHVGMDSMMRNYFHSAFGDTILIKGWNLQSSSDVIVACLIFFLLAVVYEALKSFRELLFRREARTGVFRLSLYNPTNGCPDDLVATSGSHLTTSLNNPEENNETAIIKCSMWSKAHLFQSVLHSIQVIISYTLMLGFMTFNSFICLSIVLGAGLGYFLFCWRKSTFINVTDHCN